MTFWLDSPRKLLKSENDKSVYEMQRAIIMFILLYIVTRSVYSFVILIFGMVYSYHLYRMNEIVDDNSITNRQYERKSQENDTPQRIPPRLTGPPKMPTVENPMGNYSIADITDPNEKVSDNILEGSKQYRDLSTEMYKQGQWDYMNDLFSDNYSSLQFYTVPNNSTIKDPNGDFQEWVYGMTGRPNGKQDPRYLPLHPRAIEGGGIGEPNGGRTQNNWLDIEVAMDVRKKILGV